MTDQLQPTYSPAYLNESNAHLVINYSIVFLVLQTIFLGLRFWARFIGRVSWGLDDTFIVASALFLTGLITACLCDVVYGGVGHHIVRVIADDPRMIVTWWKFNLIVPLLYFIAAALPKLSILALYFRVFGTPNNRMVRNICWATGGLIAGNCFANVIVAFLMCRPLSFVWNKDRIGGGTCVDINAWWRWSSFANLITDIIMLLLPLPEIKKMQVPKRVKAGIAATFLIGSIGMITAIIRFVGFFTKDFSKDSTWTGTSLLYLSIIEPGLYHIAGCLLALRPLLKLALEKSNLTALASKKKSKPDSQPRGHILQKISFKVSQSKRFESLDDGESGRDLVVAHGGAGNRTEIGT